MSLVYPTTTGMLATRLAGLGTILLDTTHALIKGIRFVFLGGLGLTARNVSALFLGSLLGYFPDDEILNALLFYFVMPLPLLLPLFLLCIRYVI